MNYVNYAIKRLKKMDYKAMMKKIDVVAKRTKKSHIAIFLDMAKCAKRYGAGYMDYELYEMYNLNDEQRETYLTRGRNNELVVKLCNTKLIPQFRDKRQFNTIFKDFLHRDWIDFTTAPREDVIKFMEKHNVFMAKPVDGGCGKGIIKVKTSDFESLDKCYDYLVEQNTLYELEEVIIQHPVLSAIYPDAVNDIRVVTILVQENGHSLLELPVEERKNAKLVAHVLCAYLRIGNGGKYVDNFNSEGLAGPIDVETGIINKVAVDKAKHVYVTHPSTGAVIKGTQIPYWKEAIEMCKKACFVVPEMGYVGWDVAITENGPCLIEGNEFPGHDIHQLPEHTPDKIGIMPKIRAIVK